MPSLLKRFDINDLPSENRCICNPIYLDGVFGYRSARPPGREADLTKTLKIAKYTGRYNIDLSSIINLQYSNFSGVKAEKIISDTRFFKYNEKIYLALTLVERCDNAWGYKSQIAIASLDDKCLIWIDFSGRTDVEKNYCFFESQEKLYFIHSIAKNKIKVYEVCSKTGWANIRYQNDIFSSYDFEGHGDFKTTSNVVKLDDCFYVNLHSHTATLPHIYNCGMMSFEANPPFALKSVSNVPLFNIQESQIIYPIGLETVKDSIGNDMFHLGMGLASYEIMDIISISKQELDYHMKNNVTFDYPAYLPKMQAY